VGSYIQGTFRLLVVSLVRVVYDAQIRSVYFYGDEGEYEILPYHFPLLGALPEGHMRVITDKDEYVYIGLRAGVNLMNENTCIVIIEELDMEAASGQQKA
jgi:F0F1-type ATP synthase epsilon subunit